MLPRRLALASLPGLALAPRPLRADPATEAVRSCWASFRERFLAPEGRVVDTGNAGISHSEGQGWAMLCAVRAGDRAGFERLHGWTMRILKRQGDELFAWRFRPGRGVDDPNNATDGDIFIAWALLEAAARWEVPDWQAQGAAIARDILRLLIRPVGEHLLLLPGVRGFERGGQVVINPSYYAFPALRALAMAVPDPAWLQVTVDGLMLLRRGRFGRWRLPPDWLTVHRLDGRVAPAPGWPARFSYDAVRVPLYLAWAGLNEEPGLTAPAGFWADQPAGRLPAWADLANNLVAPYTASRGISAVAQLSRATLDTSIALDLACKIPHVSEDYYSSMLCLLSVLAAAERGMA